MTDLQAHPHPRYRHYLDAIRWTPDDDLLRGDFADWLEENASGDAECPKCHGDARTMPQFFKDAYQWNAGDPCPKCGGSGRVLDGDALRATYIREACEFARLPKHRTHTDRETWNEVLRLTARVAAATARGRTAGWFDIPGLTESGSGPGRPLVDESDRGAMVLVWPYRPEPHGAFSPITGTVSRGFVDTITLNAAAFTEAVARAVFSAFPVVNVHLSDREPNATISYRSGDSFDWRDAAVVGSRDAIPTSIWELLRNYGGESEQPRSFYSEFPTRDAAMQALSAACVDYGRNLCGLPPLHRRDHASTVATCSG